jgi:hypothetical protein
MGDDDSTLSRVVTMVGTCPAHIPHILEPAYVTTVTYCVEGTDISRCFQWVSQSQKDYTDLSTSIDFITSTTMLGKVGPLGAHAYW